MQEESVSKSFKVGELVQYTSYYDDPVGPWKMFGDLGIVVAVRTVEGKYQVVKVRWICDSSEIDMSPECLIRIKINDHSDLTNDK